MPSLSSSTRTAAVISLWSSCCILAGPVYGKHTNGKDALSGASDSWKLAIPANAISQSGLPEGRLFALLRKNKTSEIRTLLKETPKKTGDDAERSMWLGACHSADERYEEAVLLFDQFKGWEKAPNLVTVMAARAYSEEQQFNEAIKLCSLVLAKWPMREAYQTRGATYVLVNKNEEAVADFMTLADCDPYSAKHHLMRAGNLLVKMGQFDKALALMDRATLSRGGEENLTIWLVRGDCYKAQKKWQKAIDSFTSAIQMTKVRTIKNAQYSLPIAYKERAICYDKLGKHNLAEADRRTLSLLSKSLESDLIGAPKH